MSSISYIIPAYNCAGTIPLTIRSIFDNNIQPGDEIIVVDDHSADNTIEVVGKLQAEYPAIRLVRHRHNKGSAASGRNTAIEHAKNDLFFCIDSDNILAPESVPELKEYLLTNDAGSAAFGEIWYFQDSPRKVTHSWKFPAGVFTLADALSRTQWPGPDGNYMFTRESWLRARRQHEFVGGGIDSWAFGIRQLATGTKMMILEGTGYYHKYGHDSAWIVDYRKGAISLKALQVLIPFLHVFPPAEVEYLFSRRGRYDWFMDLDKRPLKVKDNFEPGEYKYSIRDLKGRNVLSEMKGYLKAATVKAGMFLKNK